jgi:anti-sigma regulatory factor (Ser/Thr protein kinase)
VSDDQIRLSLPALPEFARLARLTVAGVANRLDFSYDEVEDLRIAVGEACSMLVARPEGDPADAGGRRIELVFNLGDGELGIEVTGGPGVLSADDDRGLTDLILEAVVDSFAIDLASGTVSLSKRRAAGRA